MSSYQKKICPCLFFFRFIFFHTNIYKENTKSFWKSVCRLGSSLTPFCISPNVIYLQPPQLNYQWKFTLSFIPLFASYFRCLKDESLDALWACLTQHLLLWIMVTRYQVKRFVLCIGSTLDLGTRWYALLGSKWLVAIYPATLGGSSYDWKTKSWDVESHF